MGGLFKIIIGIAVLLGLVLLGTFISDKYSGSNPKPGANPQDGQLPISASEKDEKEIKTLAENFVRIYKTYQLGDFSGLENLKDQMTAKLWQEKAEWIAAKKREMEKQPKRYITYSAFVKSSKIIFNDKDAAEAEINYIQRETKGAMLQGEITIKYVNEFGEDKPTPPAVETPGKIRLWLVKENGEWKVDQIK